GSTQAAAAPGQSPCDMHLAPPAGESEFDAACLQDCPSSTSLCHRSLAPAAGSRRSPDSAPCRSKLPLGSRKIRAKDVRRRTASEDPLLPYSGRAEDRFRPGWSMRDSSAAPVESPDETFRPHPHSAPGCNRRFRTRYTPPSSWGAVKPPCEMPLPRQQCSPFSDTPLLASAASHR